MPDLETEEYLQLVQSHIDALLRYDEGMLKLIEEKKLNNLDIN
jgi:hypothetical protein